MAKIVERLVFLNNTTTNSETYTVGNYVILHFVSFNLRLMQNLF